MKIRIPGRLLAVISGVFATLLFLEVVLRIGGAVVQWAEARGDTPAPCGHYTILCLGDSFTAGYFALPPRDTYPEQLDALFAARSEGDEVSVVNGGQSGYNTFQIWRQLPDNVDRFHPNMVALLAGGANAWDLYGYYRYYDGDSMLALEGDLLYRIRVFKLVKLLYLCLSEKAAESGHPGEAVFNAQALRARDFLESEAVASRDAFDTAEGLHAAGDFSAAEALFEAAIESNTESVANHVALGRLHDDLREYDESIEHYLAALEIQSRGAPTERTHVGRVKILKRLLVRASGSPAYHSSVVRQFRSLVRRRPELRRDLAAFEASAASYFDVDNWIRNDIEQIINYCDERGIALVLQNYPRRAGSRFEDGIYGEIAEGHDVHFVDHAEIFSRAGDDERYFVPSDDHPSADGNLLMAQSIHDVAAPLVAAMDMEVRGREQTRDARVTTCP